MNLTAEVVGLVITVVLVETCIAAQKDKRESSKLEIGEGGVYFIINIMVPEQKQNSYDDYIKAVKLVVESYGGHYLVRSEAVTQFIGEACPDSVIIIKFSDRHRLEACFSSPEYKQIECLLTADVTANAFIVEESLLAGLM